MMSPLFQFCLFYLYSGRDGEDNRGYEREGRGSKRNESRSESEYA